MNLQIFNCSNPTRHNLAFQIGMMKRHFVQIYYTLLRLSIFDFIVTIIFSPDILLLKYGLLQLNVKRFRDLKEK